MDLAEDLYPKHSKLDTSFPFFAKHAPLMIEEKDTGKLVPLRLNKAQRYIHSCLEDQRRSIGRVRAIIVKGRQQGASTYISGRFYWRNTRRKRRSTYVMAHDSETTQKLFRMAECYLENVDERVRPVVGYSNRKELIFDKLKSKYHVGTAGSKNKGRGGTIRDFHGSEVAFWENALEIKSGVMESVPDAPDTEIILESTANGMDEMLYPMAMDAIAGKSDYILIFVPWFWQDEYQSDIPDDFELSEDDLKYKTTYKLTDRQMAWRRKKIVNLGSDSKFKQEYPANVIEAFQVSGDPLIKAESIIRARKSIITDKYAATIMGVDPGRTKDLTAIVIRRGREIIDYLTWPKMDQMLLAGIILKLTKDNDVDMTFVDKAEGHGAVDRCHELGYSDQVMAIDFGMGASNSDIYLNKRVEMWCLGAEWMDGNVNIPDKDDFHKDLVMVPDYKLSSNGVKQLESKDKIRQRFKRSPNIGDAWALTFAMPVQKRGQNAFGGRTVTRKTDDRARSRSGSRR
jgi:hypothetical protein